MERERDLIECLVVYLEVQFVVVFQVDIVEVIGVFYF